MKVTPISSPLPGEHIVGVSPVMQPETEPDNKEWRSRLNFWTGRALTEQALNLEQRNRAARLAWRGRLVTAGVVNGLDVALERNPLTEKEKLENDTLNGQFIHIMPGYGLTSTGEDIYVPRPLRVELDKVRKIYGPDSAVEKKLNETVIKRQSRTNWYNDFDLGNKLIKFHELGEQYVPWAAVLLLCPVTFISNANRDPQAPCLLDTTHDAFDDPRLVDASQLVLYLVPRAWAGESKLKRIKNETITVEDALTWRNRVASMVFDKEMKRVARQQLLFINGKWETTMVSDDLLPWEYFGVPIGLIGFEPDPEKTDKFRIFLDRNSVARQGGLPFPRPRPAIIPGLNGINTDGSGTPSVWHARVAQFNEELRDLLKNNVTDLQNNFRYLPPAGLLPKAALNFINTDIANSLGQDDRASTSEFFPIHYRVTAVPVVNEEVEALVAASAPMAKYDLTPPVDINEDPVPEPVCVLVPMPENKFDSDLLVIEREDPAFKAEVKRLYAFRQDWRQKRDYVRITLDDLSAIVNSGKLSWPIDPDPVTDPDQYELEPTMNKSDFQFYYPILLPSDKVQAPWKICLDFPYAKTIKLDQVSKLRLWMQIDREMPPKAVELQWHFKDSKNNLINVTSRFDPIPSVDVPDEIIKAGAIPSPVNLILSFERMTQDEEFKSLDPGLLFDSVTVTLFEGRAAIRFICAMRKDIPNAQWDFWKAQYIVNDTARLSDVGKAGWILVGAYGDRILTAPFEDRYQITAVDGIDLQKLIDIGHPGFSHPLNDALTELTPVLKEMDFRLKDHTILEYNDVGLERLIQVMTQEADKAEEVVELSIAKVQASLQRLQSVISGEPDADEALKSPAVSAMTSIRSSNVAKTQINSSMSINPNWTKKENIEVTEIKKKSFPLDDAEEMKPRLLSFTRRFAYGPAYQAYQAASAVMREVLKSIAGLSIGYIDEKVPDIKRPKDDSKPPYKEDDYIDLTFTSLREKAVSVDLLDWIGTFQFPVTSQFIGEELKNTSSGDIVAKGIHRADVTMLILRKVESYISRRRQLIKSAQAALDAAMVQMNSANLRLTTLNGKLSEVRHDLAVARTLWQEEIARVKAINDRRDELIEKEVKQLAFIRPRSVDLVSRNLPSCEFDRTDALAPIPACLQSLQDPPDELENYIQLFRHAPVAWFSTIAPRLKEINSRERLIRLLEVTQQNAARLKAWSGKSGSSSASTRVYETGYELIEKKRRRTVEQMIVKNVGAWEDHYRIALEHTCLGDLMDGSHGRNELAKAAAQELEDFGKVASCLHAEFASVLPSIRMAWVELYSQFDRPAPLRDINALPRSESLSRLSRKRFQAYIDWIFGQVDQSDDGAVSLVNDLVRMCLLLASHAPVNRLILGHVPRPMPVRPGLLLPVKTIEPNLVRVGMQFQVWKNNAVVARGIVENLRDEEVSVRVEDTHPDIKTIETDMQIHFVQAVSRK
jgi:hypothetical protein